MSIPQLALNNLLNSKLTKHNLTPTPSYIQVVIAPALPEQLESLVAEMEYQYPRPSNDPGPVH